VSTRALRKLAVLLASPAEARTAALARLIGELRGKHAPLIDGQLLSCTPERAQFIASEHDGLDGRARIRDLELQLLVRFAPDGNCLLEGTEQRAPAVDRPLAVAHAR
jgi:hypothetical protein